MWDLPVMSVLIHPQVSVLEGADQRAVGSEVISDECQLILVRNDFRPVKQKSLKSSWFHGAESEMFSDY